MKESHKAVLGNFIGVVVADAMYKAMAPINKRLDDLDEAIKAVKANSIGEASLQAIFLSFIESRRDEIVKLLPTPKDGKDGADGKSLAPEDVAPIIVQEIAKAVSAIPVPKDGKDGVNGKDAEPLDMEIVVEEVIKTIDITPIALAAAAAIPTPKDGVDGKDGADGKDAEPPVIDLKEIASEAVKLVDIDGIKNAVVGQLPVPKDGKDGINGKDAEPVDVDAIVDMVTSRVTAELPPPIKGEKGDPGEKGKDAEPIDMEVIQIEIEKAVDVAIQSIPIPKDGKDGVDGKSVDREELNSLIINEVRKFPAPKDGKDGVGLTGGVVDQEGRLILTLADGKMIDAGTVKGKDGKDGEAGLGFDDLNVTYDGERTFSFDLVRGDKVKSKKFTVPHLLYRGVFKEGTSYQIGDVTTWSGSLWYCKSDNNGKPGEGNPNWTLMAKRGRDGKTGAQGKAGKDGAPGAKGKDGRDLTQVGPNGSKW